MIILDDIVYTPDQPALLRRLHIDPADDLAAEVTALIDRAADVARPKAMLKEAFVESRRGAEVVIDTTRFTSRVLAANLAEVHRVFPYVATCGTELDTLLGDTADPIMHYALDCIKEAALRVAQQAARTYLQEHYGLSQLSAMHPGSGDANVWPIEQQTALFALLGNVEQSIGVRLTESCLMVPNKTVSGIFFASASEFITCQLCRRAACPGRRAPFDEQLWREKNS